jgi:hypothetical protein
MRGNVSAVQFLELITNILHLWDDLHDKDKPIADRDVDRGFWNALIELPRNSFYCQNFAALNTTLTLAIQNWHAANVMEDSDSETDKEIAFIVRSSYVDLVILCALIVGGYEWSREITPEIRRLWHNETLAGYKANLAQEKLERSRHVL